MSIIMRLTFQGLVPEINCSISVGSYQRHKCPTLLVGVTKTLQIATGTPRMQHSLGCNFHPKSFTSKTGSCE